MNDALLRSILENPADDAPRLVYADWLDDHGEPVRAEFIRVQCRKGDLSYSWQYKIDKHHWRTTLGCRWVSDLVLAHEKVTGTWPSYSWGSSASPTGPGLYKSGAEKVWMKYSGCVEVEFTGGFVASVSLPLAVLVGGECGRCGGTGRAERPVNPVDFRRHGETCPACRGERRTPGIARDLFARHPVTEVRLTDKQAWQMGQGVRFGWTDDPNDFPGPTDWYVPKPIHSLLTGRVVTGRGRMWYTRREGADRDLSRAVVAWGRSLAGLPPLDEKAPGC